MSLPLNPTKISAKFSALSSTWAMCDALYGGTSTMRAAGRAYLPKNEKESDKDYDARLNRTTLYNAYKRAILTGAARVFSKDLIITGYPTELTLFTDDVDAQDRDITQFSKAMFIDALHRGVSYLLVDFPQREQQPLTLADALGSGDRPYWVPIKATQVLAAHSKLVNGVERLTHFRFIEHTVETSENGLDESVISQVKVFNHLDPSQPVEYVIYRQVRQLTLLSNGPAVQNRSDWVEHERGVVLGVDKIPVVPIYTNRTGFYIGEPPLLDLAELNVQHWQSSSEQRNILHVARVPFLHIKGLGTGIDPETGARKEHEISIHSALVTGDQGDAKWVETNGNALKAGFDDLADIEAKMEQLGLMLTVNRSGDTTATETVINAAEANSLLKDYALGLSDALEQAMYLTAQYMGLGEVSGTVEVDTSFSVDVEPQEQQPTLDPQAQSQTQELIEQQR